MRYFDKNYRQQTLTVVKETKYKAELHLRDTAALTNLRQQALTEIINK